MTRQEKVAAAIWRALPLLPAEVAEELKALLEPTALAIIVIVLIVWAVSHFFGVGEIADVIIIIVGIVSLGPIAWKAGEALIGFAMKSVYGETEADLDQAAHHLAEAISLVGVQVVMTLLLKKAPKVFREPKVLMNKPATPLTIKTVGEPPVTKGKLFYELPEINIQKHPFPAKEVPGSTDQWGRTTILAGKNSSLKDIQLAKFHEEFHRLLAPKLQTFKWLRQARAVLKTNSYLKSYLLRYIEEALAETTARIRVDGLSWRSILEGVKFPIGKEGYVTIAKMGVEAQGILLGPVNVGGTVFRAYFSDTEKW